MLGQRRRRGPSINPTLGQCVVFADDSYLNKQTFDPHTTYQLYKRVGLRDAPLDIWGGGL